MPDLAGPLAVVRAKLARHGPALAGYVAITAVVFWPAVWHWRTRILGDSGDGSLYLWNMWAIPRSIGNFDNPFSTDLLFHPLGARTAFNTNMPFWSVVTWPLQAVFGLAAAANLAQLAAIVLTGFGAYLLADHVLAGHVTDARPAAFVAGAAYTLIPYRFGHLAQFSLGHLEVLPFGLLALLKLLERPTRGRAAAFGAVVGIAFLTDLYYTVFLLLASALVAAWHWRTVLRRETALRLAQAAAVAAAVASPLLLAMFADLRADTLDPLSNWANADNYNSDLLSWVVPSNRQKLWGSSVAGINNTTTGGERLAFPGYLLLALAIVGLVWGIRRRRALWAAMFGAFFVLSLGPFLRVNGDEGDRFTRYGVHFDWPLPYFVLHEVPIVNGVRVPGRFSVMAILALAVLASMGLARLAALRPRLAWAVPAVALVLIFVELWPSEVQTFPSRIPSAYSAIARDPGKRAVLEVPLQWRTGFQAVGDTQSDETVFMYYATRHGKPLAGGMVARFPDRRLAAIQALPVYQQVAELQKGASAAAASFTVDDLREARIGYVVTHRDRPRPEAERYLDQLGLPVLADDGTVIVRRVPVR